MKNPAFTKCPSSREATSRNGRLISEVFNECELEIMNGKDICKGVITRQNRRVLSEKSAIDLVVATYEASKCIHKMLIDELGDHRVRNKNDSDHNTVIVEMKLGKKSLREENKATTSAKPPPQKEPGKKRGEYRR